jgi:hypothetical protein
MRIAARPAAAPGSTCAWKAAPWCWRACSSTRWRAPPDSCPAERARYRLNAPADFTAELHGGLPGTPAASNLALSVRSGRSGHAWWFVFAAAQGYGGLSILPVEPPGPGTAEDGLTQIDIEPDLVGRLGFHALSERLEVAANAPQAGLPAPRHLFMPGLGLLLHYGDLPGTPAEQREHLPIALFTLSECRAP